MTMLAPKNEVQISTSRIFAVRGRPVPWFVARLSYLIVRCWTKEWTGPTIKK